MTLKNKHISTYSDFILEQDMMAAAAPPAPGAAAPQKIKYHFLFMTGSNDSGRARRKYPDGSVTIEYPSYSIDSETLKKWINENIIPTDSNKLSTSEIDVRKKNLEEIVKGDKVNISEKDLPFIEKLKNAVSSNLIATVEPDVTVVFTKEVPTTDSMDVTFIKHKK